MDTTDPSTLFASYLIYLATDLQKWKSLWAEDGVLEFPYAASLGAQTRYEGRDAIHDHIASIFDKIRDIEITNVVTHRIEGGNSVITEFDLKGTVIQSGKLYEQKYIELMIAQEGKIVYLKGYWNPDQVRKAFA